ncbi:MAG: amino acid ABC transporter substrate-binding protein [Selenomonadaceae bacterium]|nr:amino acid ABC transporter substrate-binding protein [Selenomonadaceae bacterium]
MRKFFNYALRIMLCTFLIVGCGSSNAQTKLVIGFDEEFAPMGFRDEDGKIVGFDVDLAKEAARRMGVAIEFKPIEWDNKEEEITSGNVDMIWNGLDIMDEYKEYMIFTRPYMNNRQVLMVKDGNYQIIRSEYDLEGKVVGTQAGSNSEDYINRNKRLKDSLKEFKTYRNIREGFELLCQDEYDVIIIDEIAARYEMMRHPVTVNIINLTIGSPTKFGVGFRKDNVELRDKVQEVLKEMIRDGTAREISLKWFQADLIKHNR